mgnify:FL=1
MFLVLRKRIFKMKNFNRIIILLLFVSISYFCYAHVFLADKDMENAIKPESVERVTISYIPFSYNSDKIPKEKVDSVVRYGRRIHLVEIYDYNEFNILIKMLNNSQEIDSIPKYVYQMSLSNDNEEIYSVAFLTIKMRTGKQKEWIFTMGKYAYSEGKCFEVYMGFKSLIKWYIINNAGYKSIIEQ